MFTLVKNQAFLGEFYLLADRLFCLVLPLLTNLLNPLCFLLDIREKKSLFICPYLVWDDVPHSKPVLPHWAQPWKLGAKWFLSFLFVCFFSLGVQLRQLSVINKARVWSSSTFSSSTHPSPLFLSTWLKLVTKFGLDSLPLGPAAKVLWMLSSSLYLRPKH